LQLPIIWTGLNDSPTVFANQMLLQLDAAADGAPDSVLLMFGHASQPPLLGTPEEVRRQAEALDHVDCKVVARIALGPKRVREFATVMLHVADQLEAGG